MNLKSYTIIYYFNFNSQRKGLSVDYSLPAIMATTAALLGKSTVDSLGDRLGICFYTLLGALPSCGKSNAMTFSSNAMCMIENYFKIPISNSIQINAPTVETLLRLMRDNPVALCKFL